MKNKFLIPLLISGSAFFYACSEADLLDTNSQIIAEEITAYTDSARQDKVPVDTVVQLSSSETISSEAVLSSETGISSQANSSTTVSSATSSTTQSSATQSSVAQSSSSDVISSSTAVSSVAVSSSSTASGTCSEAFNPTSQKPGYNTNEEVSHNGNNYRACSYATEAPSGSNTFPQGETCKWDGTIKWLDLGPCS